MLGPTSLVPLARTRSNSDLNRSLSGFRNVFFKMMPNGLPGSVPGRTVHSQTDTLRGQPGAALLAAALQDQTAGAGRHAGEESNAALAAAAGGLECSFHLSFPFLLS